MIERVFALFDKKAQEVYGSFYANERQANIASIVAQKRDFNENIVVKEQFIISRDSLYSMLMDAFLAVDPTVDMWDTILENHIKAGKNHV